MLAFGVPYISKTPDDLYGDRTVAIARVIYCLNLFVFLGVGVFRGGLAFSGKTEGGRFYLGRLASDRFTEVSAAFYSYSNVHLVITIGLTLLLWAFEGFRRRQMRRRRIDVWSR